MGNEEPDVENFRRKLGVHQVIGADVGPFLKMRPEAGLVVRIDQWLVPVRDLYYDNEFGVHVIEMDLSVDGEPREAMLREKLRAAEGRPYFCPTSGQVEDPHQGGFDVCCDRPELHRAEE